MPRISELISNLLISGKVTINTVIILGADLLLCGKLYLIHINLGNLSILMSMYIKSTGLISLVPVLNRLIMGRREPLNIVLLVEHLPLLPVAIILWLVHVLMTLIVCI